MLKGANWADLTAEEEERQAGVAQQRQQQQQQPQQQQQRPPNASPSRQQQQQQQHQHQSSTRPSQDQRGSSYGQPQRSSRDTRESGYGGYGGYGSQSRGGGAPLQQAAEAQWSRGEQLPDRRGGGGGGSGSSYGRGGGGGGRDRAPRSAQEELSAVETGLVGSVKDSFGFIRCADRDGELFFHFSDVIGDDLLRRGDEVSFRVSVDPRNGRARAVQLTPLPPGSVQFEVITEERVRGVVTQEMRGQVKQDNRRDRRGPKMSLAESLAQGRAEAYGGKIKRLPSTTETGSEAAASSSSSSSSSADMYEFSERDLADPNVLLYVGDVIEFSIFLEKKSQRRGATKVTLIEPNPLGRERGRVVMLKPESNFGFMQVEEEMDEEDEEAGAQQTPARFERSFGQQKDQQIFFHFSELLDPSRLPQVGDEMSFRIEQSPAEGNKVSAQRIQLLPKGSLNSREVAKETSTGVVTKEISYEKPEKPEKTKKADKAEKADKEQTDAAEENDTAETAAADSTSVSTDAPATSPPAPSTSPSSSSTPAASSASSTRPRPKLIPGEITYTDSTGASITLPFRPTDILQDRQDRRAPPTQLLKGDTVQFRVLTLKTKKGVSQRATQVSIQPEGFTTEGREQGVVSLVKEGFAFVDSVSRPDKLFLHQSQLRQPTFNRDDNPREKRPERESLYQGMEVEFNVVAGEAGKLSAIRATVLPQGSVQFYEDLPYTFTGVVSKGIKVREQAKTVDSANFSKNDLRSEQPQRAGRGEKGEIKHLALAGDSEAPPTDFHLPKEVAFWEENVLAPAAANLDTSSLLTGDVVRLRLQRHKGAPKKLRADQVQLQQMNPSGRTQGVVAKIKEGMGYLDTLTRTQPLPFFLRDAPKGESGRIQVGDCFEFNVADSNAVAGKKQKQEAGEHKGALAVRLTPLPRGSVEVETVDRSRLLRGYVSQVPERPGQHKFGKQQEKGSGPLRPGQVVVLQSERGSAPVQDVNRSHPGAWGEGERTLAAAIQAAGAYTAEAMHPAHISLESKSQGEEKYNFLFKDLANSKSFLCKGDLLDFYVAERQQPQASKRAVELQVVPLQGRVERIEQGNGSKPYTGTISVFNPQALHSEEMFLFSGADVVQPAESTPADAASSSSPPPPVQLGIGDLVEFSEVVPSQERKKRQAKQIRRVKEAPQGTRVSEARPGSKRAAGAPLASINRFARGPDKEGVGFDRFKERVAQRKAAGAATTTETAPSAGH